MKNYLIISIVAVTVLIIMIFIIKAAISTKPNGNQEMTLSQLMNSESIISSATIYYGTTIAIYPSAVSTTYFNLNSDGILYKFNDNGYNLNDPEATIILLAQKSLNNSQSIELTKELKSLAQVPQNELLKVENDITYVQITFKETKEIKIVYKEEFENIINKYLK